MGDQQALKEDPLIFQKTFSLGGVAALIGGGGITFLVETVISCMHHSFSFTFMGCSVGLLILYIASILKLRRCGIPSQKPFVLGCAVVGGLSLGLSIPGIQWAHALPTWSLPWSLPIVGFVTLMAVFVIYAACRRFLN